MQGAHAVSVRLAKIGPHLDEKLKHLGDGCGPGLGPRFLFSLAVARRHLPLATCNNAEPCTSRWPFCTAAETGVAPCLGVEFSAAPASRSRWRTPGWPVSQAFSDWATLSTAMFSDETQSISIEAATSKVKP